MTEIHLKPEDAIRLALAVAEGTTARVENVVLKAIDIAGYDIVPKGGAPGAKPPPPPKPRGPVMCQKCNRVRNNGGEQDACDRTDCPF